MAERDGLLVVDKPMGLTSFDIIRKVRKVADMRKVGHTGTLDPDATGVLAVALGRCTKLSRFLVFDEKRYVFTMRLGEATDTDDASGEVIRKAAWDGVNREDFEAKLPQFIGNVEQVPPIFSAIKVDGKRAYALARAGDKVELESRQVRIDDVRITRWALPEIDLEVACGPGTYIRSLARDLGEAVGSAAHTTMIRRLSVGPFSIEQAVDLEMLTVSNFWSHALSPLEMVQSLPRYEVDEEMGKRIHHGQPIEVAGPWEAGTSIAAHDCNERLVAVMECRSRQAGQAQLWPKRVMS